MYAVVRTGGRQYRVEEGRLVKVGKLAGEPGDTVELGDVLLMADGDDISVGMPAIDGARVLGEIREQGRERKIVVFKYKSKTRARKKTGHRQHFTRVVVRDILAPGQEPKPREEKPAAVEEAPAPPKGRRARKAAPVAEPAVAEAAAVDESEAEPTEPVTEAPAEKPKRRSRKAE